MKNHMNKVLALLVALLVLCAPIGAMAEETPSVTLALSNLSLSMGEDFNLNVDVTARLDVTADMENGAVAGTLTALAGADKAMKGGFTFDMSTMNLNAALEGASTAIQVPMTDVVTMLQQQMGGMFSDEQIAKLQAVYAAYMNLMNVVSEKGDVLTGAVQEKLGAWLNGVMTEGYKGQTTVTVQDTELTAEQYDYEMTIQEMAALGADEIKAIQGDAELCAAVQAFIDAVSDLAGEETVDIASLDMDAALTELEGAYAKLAGSLYIIDETSFVLDLNLVSDDQTIPCRFVVLAGESDVYTAFSVDATTESETVKMTMEATAPTDGTPKFSCAVTGTQGSDGDTQDILFTIDGDFSDGLNFTVYVEAASSFTYGEETYKSLNAFGVSYTGAVTGDENGMSVPGTLVLYVNNDGTEITLSADILLAMNNANTVSFDMPANAVNILEADEETMNALYEEYMGLLSSGLMSLMGAPGMEDAMTMFG